jgi:integrase
MTTKPLTDTVVRTARPPATGRVELRDMGCRGLALRITANDVRSWTFRYTDQLGRDGRVALGRYPDVSLAAARSRADEMRREVAGGVNPVAVKRKDRAEAGSKTFQHLADRYMKEHALRHKRSADGDERNLRKHILPKWGKRRYADIARADVIEIVEGLITDGKDTLANRVGALISKIFSFALDAGLLTTHPATRLGKRGVESQGSRVLSDDELPVFWNRIVEAPVSRGAGLALRLQLVTALRPGEAAGLRRSELIEGKTGPAILLPPERTKNRREHLLPLSPLAQAVIADALKLTPEKAAHIFPSPQVEGAPIEGHALAVAMRRFGDALAGPKSWKAAYPTPHDLRRTVRTRLAALGVPRESCDAIMNHAPQDIGRKHYDRHDAEGEKRLGLEQWSRAFAAIIKGDKAAATVVPLRRKRR